VQDVMWHLCDYHIKYGSWGSTLQNAVVAAAAAASPDITVIVTCNSTVFAL